MNELLSIDLSQISFGALFVWLLFDTNKKNENRQFKLTWEEYSNKEGPGLCMAFAIVLWPVFVIITICYYMFQYPIDRIKERNGIK